MAVSALATATVLTACSGSDSGSASAGGPSPIVIGVMAPVGTPQVDFGGIFAAVKASAAVVNKQGGINGRPIEVFTCNTQYQANQELACARQAVAKHAVAMVGNNNALVGTAMERILAQAHIADIANVGPLTSNYQGDNTFPLTWEIGSFFPCASKELAQKVNADSVVMVQSPVNVLDTIASMIGNGARTNGLRALPPIVTADNVSDYSPYVAQAQQSGAKIVVLGLLGSGPQAFVRASSAAGAKYTICTALGLTGSGGWADLGAATNQLYVGATFRPLSEAGSLPLLKTMLDSMAAEEATGDKYANTSPQVFQAQSMGAWLGVQAFAQVAKTIPGDVTAESFLPAITKAKVNLGDIIQDIDFTKARSAGDYQRVYNSDAYLWKWDSPSSQYHLEGSVKDTLDMAVG
ncbi:MAG TPA: ABC transporter substrate-binding protein [Amycolatopsis sp.]|uniref:ABC transporter substrate-binding protein n=1 Tax=Amycolatopsis sp. TaxID=37632 RepID=UPI002B47B6CC|nr:ABC transporter substrate-binding protein [Amycolatopsis sp.]HKS48180.1 ABC transporter substrate-binding protein [Amycolatopsis sp.]